MITSSILILLLFKFSYTSQNPKNQDCGNLKEAIKVRLNHWKESKYLCPATFEADLAKLRTLAQKFYSPLKHCLFEKFFLVQQQEKLCNFDVNPIFAAHLDDKNDPIKCGFKKHQYLHYFGYYYCGGSFAKEKLLKVEQRQQLENTLKAHKPDPIPLFDVCFDISKKKTIYTTHTLYHPSHHSPQNPQLKKPAYCESEISTEPFFMDSNQFLNTRQLYESLQISQNGQVAFPIIPHPMVSAEFFASPELKRATNHYINRAPLWEKLAPLMALIDHGIKEAAHRVWLQRSEPHEKLLIYTRTMKFETILGKFTGFFKRNRKPFEPSIWYKLLYNEVKKQAVMIYVHNTPSDSKEVIIDKQCPKNMLFDCDLKVWSRSDTVDFLKIIPSVDLKYMYCCKVTSSYAKKIFSEYFDIEDVLDIDSLIRDPVNEHM